ncbi:restriction endonuclease [Spirillospora sp. NPDC000708]
MDSYEIGRLTDFDFESLCKDIFEELLGVQLEIFAPGADQGVDLRHLRKEVDSSTIIQCKHWMRTGRSKFLSKMKEIELPKVRRLAPSRYIVATTVELTKAAKDSLLETFSPYIQSSGDIYGLQEIESELRKHPQIVQRHPRLWLNSTAILQSLMAKEIVVRSHALAEDLDRSLASYVPNESLMRSQNILDAQHVVVISGAPGIGKTTLAQVLTAAHLSQGYSLVEISEDAEEANRLWIDDERQIFYYDDFLGQTTLEDKLGKNEDSRLLTLLRRVHGASNKRFVLTTREYIFRQARQRYEKLARSDFSPMTCVVDLADYTKRIRAQILYNHIYFSSLPARNKAIFAKPEIYNRIINHRGFNPRLIHLSLEASSCEEGPRATAQRLYDDLENPERIWQHIVEHQLDESSVSLLEIVFSLGAATPLEAVRAAWRSYQNVEGRSEQLRRSLQVLEDTLIKVHISKSGDQSIGFANPSIRDYMREYLSARPELVEGLLKRAIYFEQVQYLWTFGKGHRGKRLLSALCANKDVLHDAVVRTLSGPHPRSRWSNNLVGRSEVAIRIAEHLDSSHLAKTVDELALSQIDFAEDAADGDSIVSLITTLATSQFQPMVDRAVALIDGAIEYAMADLWSWDNIEYADALIANLERLSNAEIGAAVEAARFVLEERMDDVAFDSFERWSENLDAVLTDSPPAEMEGVVSYASRYSNAEELFESYDVISDHLKDLQKRKNESTPLPKINLVEEAASVDQILGILGENSI